MSAAGEGASTTAKATTSDAPSGPKMKDQKQPPAALEEDDEFEDFPVDGIATSLSTYPCILPTTVKAMQLTGACGIDWPASEQEVPPGREQEGAGGQHLWEESWDDDDTNEEFSKQLKYVYVGPRRLMSG